MNKKTQKNLKITLIRSGAGCLPVHRATLVGLGLRRLRQSVVREDTACIRGMINRVHYLVNVEQCA